MAIPYSVVQYQMGSLMRDSQLEKMSLKELVSLDAKIKAAIGEKRVSERHDLKAKMEELARASASAWANCSATKVRAAKVLLSTATRRIRRRPGRAAVVNRIGSLRPVAIRTGS